VPYPFGPGRGIPGIGGSPDTGNTIGDFGGGYLNDEILFPGGLTVTREHRGSPYPGAPQNQPKPPPPSSPPAVVTPSTPTETPPPTEPDYPFNPSDPYPHSEPVEPTVGAPVHGDDPTAGGDWPTDPYYPPQPAKQQSGPVFEGEYSVRPPGVDKLPRGGWDPSQVLDRILGSVIGRIVSRVAGGPIGTVIEEIFTPTQIDVEPDVRGMLPPSTPRAPSPVPSNPPTPRAAAPPAPARPPRPELPPVPRAPTVSVPKPDIGVQPWKFDSQLPQPSVPRASPSAPPMPSSPATTAPRPATSSQPAPQSPTQPASSATSSPRWRFDPLPLFGTTHASSPTPTPFNPSNASPTLTSPSPSSTSAPAPTAPGTLTAPQTSPIPQAAGSAPPLTPINPAALESLPAGESCETPKQQKQRRERQRENCNRFITITIPKHRRKVCVAEAAHHLGKHLGKEIGRAITNKLGITKPKREGKGKKPAKLRISKRGGISYGGYGVSIPKQMRPRPPGEIPRL
jgi:hypothetical protein